MEAEMDGCLDDPIDEIEVFELIRHISDPEYPLTLEQLNVVNVERVYLRSATLVEVYFTPTIPHCSMAQMIGLMLRVKLLRFLPRKIKSRVMVTPGSHGSEAEINKQINDKERVAAAIENPKIGAIIAKGFINSDRFEF
jgi:metal-sulfur cluster biosynthetic enzyme